jgi:hypothetical protein
VTSESDDVAVPASSDFGGRLWGHSSAIRVYLEPLRVRHENRQVRVIGRLENAGK